MAAERLRKFDAAMSAVTAEMLLPIAVDHIARTNPTRVYAEIPLSTTTFDAGFRTITYGDLANAVNGVAWWIHDNLGPSETCEPLCYMGPNDLTRNLVLLGCCKSGYSTLMMSPRFNSIAHENFINNCECDKLIMPEGEPSTTQDILELYTRILRVPDCQEFFDKKNPHYEFGKTFEAAKKEPLVILHTSGTTGFPKPIIWSHEYANAYILERWLSPPEGFESADRLLLGGKIIIAFPPAHAGPTWVTLFHTIFCGSTIVYLLTGSLPSVNMLMKCLEHKKVDGLMLTPPQLEEVVRTPGAVDYVSQRAETMFYAGGDIAASAGNSISSHMKLITTFGSTEQGFWHTLYPLGAFNPATWKYVRPHPKLAIQFRHHTQDFFEAVYVKKRKPTEHLQPIFTIFPDQEEYFSTDLFSPHPNDPQIWQFRGRADDMQCFITAEKFHPTEMERVIGGHPDVMAVLFIGTRRPKGSLLIELIDMSQDQSFALEKLWPVIEEANKPVPFTAKITKSMVLFTSKDLPMKRTDKGTIERVGTVKLYEDKLDMLYQKDLVLDVV